MSNHSTVPCDSDQAVVTICGDVADATPTIWFRRATGSEDGPTIPKPLIPAARDAIDSFQPGDAPKRQVVTPCEIAHSFPPSQRGGGPLARLGIPRHLRLMVHGQQLSVGAARRLARIQEVNATLWELAEKAGLAEQLRARLI
jgi:hypothetical protein